MRFVTGWFGQGDISEFYREDDGRNIFIRNLIEKLEANFSNEDIEVHFNTQFTTKRRAKNYLILLEHEYIRPQNYFHKKINYDLIFGWDLRQQDNKKFIYVRYPHQPNITMSENARTYRYSMLCSNRNILFGKKSHSLYYERQKVISYAENTSKDFSLFGSGWDFPYSEKGFASRIKQEYLKRSNAKKPSQSRLRCYKGKATSKREVLNRSVFNFCYENIRSYEGYVSEKLWDAVAARCIPVYWPSSTTYQDLIPRELVIDASKFETPRHLFKYLDSICESEISNWQNELAKLLPTLLNEITYDNYSNVIVNAIKKDLRT